MKVRQLFVLLLNCCLLSIGCLLFKIIFQDSLLYKTDEDNFDKLNQAIVTGFQMLVQIYLTVLLLHVIYYVFHALFLKHARVFIRAILFAAIVYLLMMVLMLAGPGYGPRSNFFVKAIPFAGLGFCLSFGEHWISRWAFKQNASNSERQ